MRAEFVIAGSGITGAVIARMLADAGRSVVVVERRAHVGGNVHDHVHASGIRVHTYGPHYFRTNDDRLWAFARRFADFHPYEAVVKSRVNGRLENWPVSAECVDRLAGAGWKPGFTGEPRNFEEAALSMLPRPAYEAFVKGYTQKQWGRPATELPAALARRFDLRTDGDPRHSLHVHQGIPRAGYAAFMENLLAGIPVVRDCDYLLNRGAFEAQRALVYTGALDEFFGFDLGRLPWRGQRREHEYLPDAAYALPCGQVNEPDASVAYVRTLEWKHMMPPAEAAGVRGTVLTREFPVTPTDPAHFEYPCADDAALRLYAAYRARADAIPGLVACGRLGDYRYYDMDQAAARAMLIARQLLARSG